MLYLKLQRFYYSGGALMMIYEDQDLGGSSNEGENKISPVNDENFFSIKLNEVQTNFIKA